MPNRIIKESICYSDDLDKLTPFEETVFYRLLVRCDDYGRLDARPGFLRSMLFVTKKGVTDKSVEEAVARMASIGIVRLYTVDGKPFLLFPKWPLHQRIRESKEKYPPPSIDNSSRQVAASCGELPPESNPNPNPNPKKESGAAAPAPSSSERRKYGEYGWVRLTDAQYQRLIDEYGGGVTEQYITCVDEYAQSNQNKQHYKDWNLVVRKAIREKWGSHSADKNSSSKHESPFYEGYPTLGE